MIWTRGCTWVDTSTHAVSKSTPRETPGGQAWAWAVLYCRLTRPAARLAGKGPELRACIPECRRLAPLMNRPSDQRAGWSTAFLVSYFVTPAWVRSGPDILPRQDASAQLCRAWALRSGPCLCHSWDSTSLPVQCRTDAATQSLHHVRGMIVVAVVWSQALYCSHLAFEGDSNAVLPLCCTAAPRGVPCEVGCPGHLVQGRPQPEQAAKASE